MVVPQIVYAKCKYVTWGKKQGTRNASRWPVPVLYCRHCRPPPPEDLQHCRPSHIFVKFRILILGDIEKGFLNHNKRLFMQYLTFNDKRFIFSYVNDGYFSTTLQQLIWIYKDKTYNDWSGMGEDLQWGKVCNDFSIPLQIFRGGEGLQLGGRSAI